MNKDLNQKLNKLKEEAEPDEQWVESTKNDLFEKETPFLLQVLEPKFAFGSFAMASLIFALMVVNSLLGLPEVKRVENKVTPEATQFVEERSEETTDEETVVASKETEEFSTEVNLDKISEDKKKLIAQEAIEELSTEAAQLEKRMNEVLASKTGE